MKYLFVISLILISFSGCTSAEERELERQRAEFRAARDEEELYVYNMGVSRIEELLIGTWERGWHGDTSYHGIWTFNESGRMKYDGSALTSVATGEMLERFDNALHTGGSFTGNWRLESNSERQSIVLRVTNINAHGLPVGLDHVGIPPAGRGNSSVINTTIRIRYDESGEKELVLGTTRGLRKLQD